MRILLTCTKCFKGEGEPAGLFYPAELQDSGLYKMTCREGHETVTCLQEMKFEVLYEIAANAIIDGYYREAVTSFASCLERFFEFYIQVVGIKHGVAEDQFQKAWKSVSSQSERQRGAFVFLYLLENNASPSLLSNPDDAFRNEVVHKGRIPSRQEAVDFGNSVLSIVSPMLEGLKRREPDAVNQAVGAHVKKTREQAASIPLVSFLSIPTTISICRSVTEPVPTLHETLTRLSHRPHVGVM